MSHARWQDPKQDLNEPLSEHGRKEVKLLPYATIRRKMRIMLQSYKEEICINLHINRPLLPLLCTQNVLSYGKVHSKTAYPASIKIVRNFHASAYDRRFDNDIY
jgi:hypothetical protein